MSDPYQILGVSPSATDDEIKKAYRKLSKMYHPDMNINNPNKEETTKKFKEVQNAYDQIMDMKKHGYSSYNQYANQSSSSANNSYYSSRQYADFNDFFSDFFSNAYNNQYQNTYQSEEQRIYSSVVQYINSGYYQEALNLLEGINNRSAIWYYYSAIANSRIGNNVKALEHAKTALSMEPNNLQYQQLVQMLQNGRRTYRSFSSAYSSPMANYTNCCYKLILFNMFCNCCCGARIC